MRIIRLFKENQVVENALADHGEVGWDLLVEHLGVMLKNLDFNF